MSGQKYWGYGFLEPLVKANLGFYIFLQNSIHFEYGLVWNAFSHWLKWKDGQNPKLQVHSPEVVFKPSTGNYLHCNFPENLANRRKTLSKHSRLGVGCSCTMLCMPFAELCGICVLMLRLSNHT